MHSADVYRASKDKRRNAREYRGKPNVTMKQLFMCHDLFTSLGAVSLHASLHAIQINDKLKSMQYAIMSLIFI
jgi:hypothetical protein